MPLILLKHGFSPIKNLNLRVILHFIPQITNGPLKADPIRSSHLFGHSFVFCYIFCLNHPLSHNSWLPFAYFHNHVSRRTLYCKFRFLIPKPQFFFPVITKFHFTKWNPFFSLLPCHRNFHSNTVQPLGDPAGIGKKDIMWVGRVSRTKLIVSIFHP